MKRIPIARGAGDPAQLRTPGLPQFDAPGEPSAAENAGASAAEGLAAAAATVSAPARKSRLGPLLGLLVIVAVGAGGYWLWQHPEVVGFESWGEVQAAFSGENDDAAPDAAADETAPEGAEAPAETPAAAADEVGGDEGDPRE